MSNILVRDGSDSPALCCLPVWGLAVCTSASARSANALHSPCCCFAPLPCHSYPRRCLQPSLLAPPPPSLLSPHRPALFAPSHPAPLLTPLPAHPPCPPTPPSADRLPAHPLLPPRIDCRPLDQAPLVPPSPPASRQPFSQRIHAACDTVHT